MKAEENIKKGFCYSTQWLAKAEACLQKGIILEKETDEVSFEAVCNVTQFKPKYNQLAQKLSTIASITDTNKQNSTATPSDANKQLTSSQLKSKSVDKSMSGNQLSRDKMFLQALSKIKENSEVQQMKQIKDSADVGISYIDERQKFWQSQHFDA